jgi:hypothetical protein
MRRAEAIALLFVAACATNTAPQNFLPTPEEAQDIAAGGWMELDLAAPKGVQGERVEGELLAVSADSAWVMTAQGGRAIATTAVRTGKLTGYRAAHGAVSGYTALGVLSTLSNGVVLIVTAPLWIIVGTTAASHESFAAQRLVPGPGTTGLTWERLALFARFPQGMPAQWPTR